MTALALAKRIAREFGIASNPDLMLNDGLDQNTVLRLSSRIAFCCDEALEGSRV